MKMNLVRKVEYKDYRIYIMQFEYVFQYLITDKYKNLYQDNITFTPSWLNRVKFQLHLTPVPFSREEMKTGEEICMDGAIKSIDAMVKDLEEEKEKMDEISRVANSGTRVSSKKKHQKCYWRAVAIKENGVVEYQCLNHPEFVVEVPEGEKPSHDLVVKPDEVVESQTTPETKQ